MSEPKEQPTYYLSSNNNAILVNKCQSLQNLTVSLQVTEGAGVPIEEQVGLVTHGNNGFSLQLNCYPQTHPTYLNHPQYWAQYVIQVVNDSVEWGIQYWSHALGFGVPGFGFSPSPNYVSFATAPSNQVPAGSVMKIALDTEQNGNVTQATFSITDPQGNKNTFTFPSDAPGPPPFPPIAIYGFQVNLVGPGTGTHTCKFTSGSKGSVPMLGFLNYSVSSGKLEVQNKNNCGGPQVPTLETSNVDYSAVLPTSGQKVGQEVAIPLPPSPPVPPLTEH